MCVASRSKKWERGRGIIIRGARKTSSSTRMRNLDASVLTAIISTAHVVVTN